jgi:hypothetical protein
MHAFMKVLSILVAIPLLISGCAEQPVQEEKAAPKVAVYQSILGKSLTDEAVADFLASNTCSRINHFELCKDAGMALWADSDQIVKIVYLYSGTLDGFRRYRGELPFGLSFYDPMWKVEEKLRELNADDILQPTSLAGLPDEGSSPDHIHYGAVYKRLNMTIVYNSPFADEDAYIYAILVTK